MQEMWAQSLDWEDPLEKGKTTHSPYSCLENPMDRGAWKAAVHGVTKIWTRLNEHTHTQSHQRGFTLVTTLNLITSQHMTFVGVQWDMNIQSKARGRKNTPTWMI